MKKILAVLLVGVMMMTLLTGCGKSGEEVGKWVLSSASEGGEEFEGEMLSIFGDVYIELKSDGTGVFCFGEATDITWGDNKLTVEEDGVASSVSYEIKSGELILDMEGTVMKFKKQ